MELTRREFCRLLAIATAALAAWQWLGLGGVAASRGQVSAQRPYPGRLRSLNQAEVSRPAAWAG